MKELGVKPLERDRQENRPRLFKMVNVGSNFKICDNLDDSDVCEAKRPKLISPNRFLFRRKIHCINYNDTDLHLSTLPDELLLSIVQYLPYKSLCHLSEVCKRLYTVATDETLWSRIDLTGRKLCTNWLMYILRRGIRIARLRGAEVASPLMSPSLAIELMNLHLKVEYMDLSEVIISVEDLEMLLSKCRMLKKLSLDSCELSDGVCREIGENHNLDTLNLCMCSGITPIGMYSIVASCHCLESLNVSWTSLDKTTVHELVSNITPKIRRLNLSGQRQTLNDRDMVKLITRCPELVEVDISDCLEVSSTTINCMSQNLFKLKYLSINRCYKINPSALSNLSSLPHFSRLNAFRLVTTKMLKRERILPNVKINKDHLSTIARPTVGVRMTSIWQLRCRK
uniref:Putative scf ubiquitin ligase skp2 component n=1 Tax=Triatoma infestans TaxID=30076 RepID=A0A023F052_TRIIF